MVAAAQDAGRYEVHWDGKDARGRAEANGIYLYKLTAGGRQALGKMLLIR